MMQQPYPVSWVSADVTERRIHNCLNVAGEF